MKKTKISARVSLYMAVMQVIVMLCMFLFTSFSISGNMEKVTISNMQTVSAERAKIIEDYVQSSEELLTAYSRAEQVSDLLYAPDDEETVASAQKYTEIFSADKAAIEGIYVCDWDTRVLVHTKPDVPGLVMRKGDSLKALQDSLLASDGVYNTGIIMSPASQKQVIAMYRACYGSDGKPAGFVGVAIFTTELFKGLNELPKNGMENSKFYLLNIETGEYIYADDEDKVGTVAEETYIVDILEKLKNGAKEDGYTGYKAGNEEYLSSYHSMAGKGWVFIMEDSKDEIFASSKKIEIFLLVICVLAAISITVLSFMLLAVFLKPLTVINKAVNRLGEGDISDNGEITGYVNRTDEIGQISQSVKHLQNHLKDTVSGITEKAVELDNSNQEFSNRFSEIYNAISGINNAVEEIAIGATGQAQDTISAEEEVKAIAGEVTRNSSHVQQLDSAVSETSGLFENMAKILDDLTDISQKTIDSISEVAAKTQATDKSSEKIREAVDMIKNITSQTNLLSLNASIEAARAGEAGKGFAVVAGEIRNLADESTRSAEEIEKRIDELVNNSDASIAETVKLNDILEKQKEELKLTIQGFDSLKNEIMRVEDVSRSINDINGRMEQQKNTLGSIIQNLSAVSEENAASCEETSATMESVSEDINVCNGKVHTLTELSENLKSQVSYFKL